MVSALTWRRRKSDLVEKPAQEHVIFTNQSFKREVKIAALGDIHIGHPDVDIDAVNKVIDYIKKNNIWVIGMGDYIENASKYSIGGSVYEQNLTPTEQINEIHKLFLPIKDKILFLLAGNHERRTSKHMGVDLTQIVAEKLGVEYRGIGTFATITVDDNQYRIYATHGKSGARKSHTKLNAVKQLTEAYTADIYIMGHMHDLMHDSDESWEVVNNQPKLREKTYIVSGHYLSKFDPHSYITEASYPPGKSGSPIITLSGKDWNVSVEDFRG